MMARLLRNIPPIDVIDSRMASGAKGSCENFDHFIDRHAPGQGPDPENGQNYGI